MALIVLTEEDPVEAISTLFRRCFLIHIPVDIILVKYFRTIGVGWNDMGSEMWTGLTTHKNVLGEVCMISGLYFLWDIFKKPGKTRVIIDIFYIAMIIYLMNGPGYSRSATAISVLFIGALVFFGLYYAPKNVESLNRFLFIGAIALFLAFAIIKLGVEIHSGNKTLSGVTTEASGRDSSLTGRTDLWEDILVIASKHPLIGVGYGSFWIGDLANNLWDKHIWRPQQGHNGYIDVYVELGIFGLFLLGGVLVSTFKTIKKKIIEDFEIGQFMMATFIMIIIHNVTESSYLRSTHHLWFIFILLALNIPPAMPKNVGVYNNIETAGA